MMGKYAQLAAQTAEPCKELFTLSLNILLRRGTHTHW